MLKNSIKKLKKPTIPILKLLLLKMGIRVMNFPSRAYPENSGNSKENPSIAVL